VRRALLILATASFVGYFAFLHLSLYYERDSLGVAWGVRPGGLYLRGVRASGPAAAAGFQADDRIVAMNHIAVGDANDMRVVVANIPRTATTWQLERNGAPLTLTMAPLARHWQTPLAVFPVTSAVLGLSLLLGIVAAWRGPPTASNKLGAWLLASLGCVFLPLWPNSMAAFWRDLPAPVEALFWPAALSSTLAHVLLFAFCARFPQPRLSGSQLAGALLPGIAVAVYMMTFTVLTVYAPERAVEMPVPDWFQFAGPLTYPLYFFGSATLLIASVRAATDITDRRRASTLLAGVAFGGVGLLIFALALGLQQTGMFFPSDALLYPTILMFCALPLSFAYAMLRHRLFDLRIIVRLGLQYALARGMILALVPLAIAALVADVLLHGDQPLRAVLVDRGWTYGVIAALTLFAYSQREQWMAALDRRFFRERYAAQQILREVVEDVGRAPDLDTAAKNVVARIDAAIHPTIAAVMRKPKAADAFVASAVAPATAAIAPLDATSAIATIVRALARPVVIGTELRRDLPAHDQVWLQKTDAEIIVPIVTDSAGDQVVLLLGPRRSEEPYSREDLDLLGAIAASLALLAKRPSDVTTTSTMAPRRVVNRYRLEALIGEGGMGVVYAAIDETLGRPVAVKLVREEQLRSGGGLERFQREARLAASLSHPNIVTVHDFGIDESGTPYLVMERLLGRSLRTAMRAERRIPWDRTVSIVQGVASAIEAAHARGMIHRDLKPENVFLTRMLEMSRPPDAQGSNSNFASSNIEVPKVLDFGIAKTTAATSETTSFATASGALVGTIAYMSPEQLAGGKPEPAWDVWALTVIAYEMLSGAHPFGAAAGSGGMAIAKAAAIRSSAPDLPKEVEVFFDRALALEPTWRPATASALAADLRTALSTSHRLNTD
jgi:hypothetical protein